MIPFRPFIDLILEPVFWPVLFFMVLALLRPLRKYFGLLLATGLLLWIAITLSPLPWYLVRARETQFEVPAESERADAALVLGGGGPYLDPDGHHFQWDSPSARAFTAVQLFRNGRIKMVILSSHRENSKSPDELTSQKELLLQMGVPDSRIRLDDQAFRTADHVVNVIPILTKENIQTVYVLTSASHMPRAIGFFAKESRIKWIPYPVEFNTRNFPWPIPNPDQSLQLFRIWQHEVIAGMRDWIFEKF